MFTFTYNLYSSSISVLSFPIISDQNKKELIYLEKVPTNIIQRIHWKGYNIFLHKLIDFWQFWLYFPEVIKVYIIINDFSGTITHWCVNRVGWIIIRIMKNNSHINWWDIYVPNIVSFHDIYRPIPWLLLKQRNNKNCNKNWWKQAGAEVGQAQYKIG